MSLRTRATGPELMDVERPDPAEVAEALRFLRFANVWLGGRRALWVTLLTRLHGNRLTMADGPQSIRQAWTPAEALAIRDAADCTYLRLTHHFGHRFCLSGARRVGTTSRSGSGSG